MLNLNMAMRSLRTLSEHVLKAKTPSISTTRPFHLRATPPTLLRVRDLPCSSSRILNEIRRRHQSTGDRPLTDRIRAEEEKDSSDADTIAMRKALSPAYQLWFTCKQCLERSGHTVSKQAYHFGTCVIECPKCKNQHLISDHLKIFSDKKMTLEDIAKEHGQILKKGRLGADGDIEFYNDDATAKVS